MYLAPLQVVLFQSGKYRTRAELELLANVCSRGTVDLFSKIGVRMIDTDTRIHASLYRVAPATKKITQILKARVNKESKLDNGKYNFGI